MPSPIFTRDKNLSMFGKIVSSKEWEFTRKKRNNFTDKKDYLNYGIKEEFKKLRMAEALSNYFKQIGVKSILGLGSGTGYFEYGLLKNLSNVKIKVTDFDRFIIKRIKKVVPEFRDAQVFDFRGGDFSKFKGKYDSVVFVNSIYVLTDEEILKLLENLYDIGCKNVFIIAASKISFLGVIKAYFKLFFMKFGFNFGRFHGYGRTTGEFEKVLGATSHFKIKKILIFKNDKRALFAHLQRI